MKSSWHSNFFPSLALFWRMIKQLWLKTHSIGADFARMDSTFSSSDCRMCRVLSAFSCIHGSLLESATDCSATVCRYFTTTPLTVTAVEGAGTAQLQPGTWSYDANREDVGFLCGGSIILSVVDAAAVSSVSSGAAMQRFSAYRITASVANNIKHITHTFIATSCHLILCNIS